MAEDAVPQKPLCCTLSPNEPQPPLLPLVSVTPSCGNDGQSGHGSGRRLWGGKRQTATEQGHINDEATQRPARLSVSRDNPEQNSDMVQVSQSLSVNLLRVCSPQEQQATQNKYSLDFDDASKCLAKQSNQENTSGKGHISTAQNADEQFAEAAVLDILHSDVEKCGELAAVDVGENPPAFKGWVIGPLLQTFKSKMASFTDIVMSPVKLFKANGPPCSADHPDELAADHPDTRAARASVGKRSEASQTLEGRGEKGHKVRGAAAEGANTSAPTFSLTQQEIDDQPTWPTLEKPNVCRHSSKLPVKVDLLAHIQAQKGQCGLTENETNTIDSGCLHVDLHRNLLGTDSLSSKSFRSSATVFSAPVNTRVSCKTRLQMSSELREGRMVELNLLPKITTGRSSLQRGSSDNYLSEDSGPGNIRESFSQTHIMENNNGRSQLSSLYFTPPDTLCEAYENTDSIKTEGGISIQTSPGNTYVLGEKVQKITLEIGHVVVPDMPSESVADSAVTARTSKRRLKLSSHTDVETDLVKRKRQRAEKCTDMAKNKTVILASGLLRGSKRQSKDFSSKNTVTDMEVTTKVPVSKGVKLKAKKAQNTLDMLNEKVNNVRTAKPSGITVSSEDLPNSVSEKRPQVRKRKADTSGSNKGLKNTNKISLNNSVDQNNLETTLKATMSKECQDKKLSEPVEAKLCKSQTASKVHSKCVHRKSRVPPLMLEDDSSNQNKKALGINRKYRKRDALSSGLGNDFVSASSALLTLELTSTDTSTLVHTEVDLKTGVNQPSKRSKKDCRQPVKSSNGFIVTVQTKESCQQNVDISSPVQPEMGPAEDDLEAIPSPSQHYPDCFVYVNKNKVAHVLGRKKEASVTDEILSADAEVQNAGKDGVKAGNGISPPASQLKQRLRRVKNQPRIDSQRRKCRKVLPSKTPKDQKQEKNEATPSEKANDGSSSVRLLRSYSCPEIPFHFRDAAPASTLYSPQHGRNRGSRHHHPSVQVPPVPHNQKWARRARRHTVCSVEVAREFAPLCLRKEVYPSRRPASYGGMATHLSPGATHSPSFLSARASSFLSSPLAFLSKGTGNGGVASAGASPFHHLPSSSSSSSVVGSSTSPSGASPRRLFSFPRPDDASSNPPPTCSRPSQISSECEVEQRQPSEEEYGQDMSCSGHDIALSEEKAFSDSEIKVVKRHEQRGKVSSIRIRRALPKPQNNLTPMGLPRPIRLKKKEFSLEEIYTNKNFVKPPESRLETILEMPLSRKNGSQCLFGQKRVKRFVDFPDVGEPRKPKKPLVGPAKPGSASSLGRPRRGGDHNSKDTPSSLSMQELDKLLCAKLEQLELWLTFDQSDS